MFTAIMILGLVGIIAAPVAVIVMSMAVRAEDRRLSYQDCRGLSHAGPAPTRLAGVTRRVTGLRVS